MLLLSTIQDYDILTAVREQNMISHLSLKLANYSLDLSANILCS